MELLSYLLLSYALKRVKWSKIGTRVSIWMSLGQSTHNEVIRREILAVLEVTSYFSSFQSFHVSLSLGSKWIFLLCRFQNIINDWTFWYVVSSFRESMRQLKRADFAMTDCLVVFQRLLSLYDLGLLRVYLAL